MFFDILIIIIIVLCAVFGFRNGFLIALSRIGGWIGALLVAFFYHKNVSDWLLANTTFYERTQERVKIVCDSFVTGYTGDGDPSAGAGGFGATLDKIGDSLATAAADQITAHLWTVIVFVGIVFGIKIILFILTLLLSKKFHGGMIGGIDGVAGLLFGLFQAIVAILVIFALLLPVSYMVSAKTHDDIERSMDSSIAAKFVYENNPLLDFIDGFLPTGLTPDKWLDPNHYKNILNGSGTTINGSSGAGNDSGSASNAGDDAAGGETGNDAGTADADNADETDGDTGADPANGANDADPAAGTP